LLILNRRALLLTLYSEWRDDRRFLVAESLLETYIADMEEEAAGGEIAS